MCPILLKFIFIPFFKKFYSFVLQIISDVFIISCLTREENFTNPHIYCICCFPSWLDICLCV